MRGRLPDRHDVVDDGFRRIVEVQRGTRLQPRRAIELLGIAQNLIGLGHGGKCLRLGLRRAAGDDDPGLRALTPQRTDCLPRLAHRLRSNGASIDHNRIAITGALRLVANHLGFGGIQPAPKGDDIDAHHAAPAPANSAASKRPLCSYSTGPVISAWSSLSRHSMARSPPARVTLTLRPVRSSRAAATAAAQAAEPQALVSPRSEEHTS